MLFSSGASEFLEKGLGFRGLGFRLRRWIPKVLDSGVEVS